jgi:hypothetical protein
MAEIVASDALHHARELKHTTKVFMSYLVGKVAAAAFIHPTIETVSAENEVRFLERYYKRHNLYFTMP